MWRVYNLWSTVVCQFKPQHVFNKQQRRSCCHTKKTKTLVKQNTGNKWFIPILKFICSNCAFNLNLLYTHHGRHNPADVDGVVSVQIVQSTVLLVLRADLEQIQAHLQNTRFILYRLREIHDTWILAQWNAIQYNNTATNIAFMRLSLSEENWVESAPLI